MSEKKPTCEMTVDDGGKVNGFINYGPCGKPAKFTYHDKIFKRRKYICGIHKRALERNCKRVGRDPQIIPLEGN